MLLSRPQSRLGVPGAAPNEGFSLVASPQCGVAGALAHVMIYVYWGILGGSEEYMKSFMEAYEGEG